jgi:hypothetical protein
MGTFVHVLDFALLIERENRIGCGIEQLFEFLLTRVQLLGIFNQALVFGY